MCMNLKNKVKTCLHIITVQTHKHSDNHFQSNSMMVFFLSGTFVCALWRTAEGGKLRIVLFDDNVECLLAVCRDCLENKLSETPPAEQNVK